MSYRHLLEKGKIGNLTLNNRIIMPAMGTSLAGPNGEITDQQIRYYEERAMGGTGLIITEFTTIDYELGRGTANQLRIDDDRFVPGFYRLANAVHKYGSKMFVQLHHAGRESNSMLTGGKQIVAPSPVTCEAIGEQPRALTTEEVKEIIQKFVMAAYRCKLAGMDGVELHGAHGYLINQFLSPNTNIRTDEYGGSFENRMRFLKEIVLGIKKVCEQDFPIIVRLSIDEFEDGGTDVELSKEISRYLEKIGVDALHASAGNYNTMDRIIESPVFEQGSRVYLAEAIKQEVSIPVIAVGGIREPKFVDRIIEEGKADFIAIGRGHIADPEWVRKVVEGREKEIRMCISCLHCVYSKGHVSCSINVRAARELEFQEINRIEEKRHVAIVGGGPGGMEAARVLSLKGYDVTIFEKDTELGGQLNQVTEPVYKKKMKWYRDYLVHEMERLQVNICLGSEPSIEAMKMLNPYAVILATGGQPLIPNIEGNKLENVCHYQDVKMERKIVKDKKVAVLGSGMVCHSTVRGLAEDGNDVTLIEVLTKSGRRISSPTKAKLFKKLEAMGVKIITDHKVEEILPNGVRMEDNHTEIQTEVEVEQVVIAMGVEAYNPLEAACRDHFENVFVIGDAAGHTTLSEATKGGFETAYLLENLVVRKDRELVGSI